MYSLFASSVSLKTKCWQRYLLQRQCGLHWDRFASITCSIVIIIRMTNLTRLITLLLISLSTPTIFAHLYNPFYPTYPYNTLSSYPTINSFSNSIQHHPHLPGSYAAHAPSAFYQRDNVLTHYLAQPDVLPTLNLLAESPYQVKNTFSVVPLVVVSKDNMRMVNKAHIMGISQQRPTMQVKTDRNEMVQCTPAVRIVLERPIVVYSLQQSVIFPAEVVIIHEQYSIPLRVGAVIAPVPDSTFVSAESPVSITVVYAVPTSTFHVDIINPSRPLVPSVPVGGAAFPDTVIVDSEQPIGSLQPQNITIISFPDRQAEPVLTVDEEDEELVNRNPPVVLAPAGIVQSTAPHTIVEPFSNSKESPILTALREEALKHRTVVVTN